MSRVVVGAGKSGWSVSVFRRIDKAVLPCDATAASLPLLQTDTDQPDNEHCCANTFILYSSVLTYAFQLFVNYFFIVQMNTVFPYSGASLQWFLLSTPTRKDLDNVPDL
ncbi:hypothetical protein [Kistimonas asteriae]|uniref:hypothetical protein n=1 Tax=Kistimonas asteriae TaxID=517724 RepID=UPI001BA58B2A|nr:hypothetical protein [Kistimonas asteriae]